MLRIIVVAGEQSENLATYLASSGSKVIGSYPTLMDGKGAIENSIFHIDKMVYVYHPTTMDIRQDMSCLLRLVTGNFSLCKRDCLYHEEGPAVAACNRIL
ncbi:MAG: hypothetical protein ACLR6B_04075 [Blautia sp.]